MVSFVLLMKLRGSSFLEDRTALAISLNPQDRTWCSQEEGYNIGKGCPLLDKMGCL